MARTSVGILTDYVGRDVQLSLTLDRYQEIMRFPPAAFNGLHKVDEESCYDCAAIWKRTDHDGLALTIAKAEEMRERELGFFLAPKYIEDEEMDFINPAILSKKHLISIGTKTTSTIELGFPVPAETGDDPVVLLVPTVVTVPSEIHVFYPGEDVEIKPTSISISAGVAIIKIPLPRLLDPEVNTNCDPAPEYKDTTLYLDTVDIKRVYSNPADGAWLIFIGNCCDNSLFSAVPQSFVETVQQAYPRIDNNRISKMYVNPGTLSGGVWTPAAFAQACAPARVRVSYLSGVRNSEYNEILTARLAHTLLPNIMPDRVSLCSKCWRGDQERNENLMTPYGDMAGAIAAWSADSRAKVGVGMLSPKLR